MFDWSTIPYKEWLPAFVAGVFSLVALLLGQQSRKGSERRGRDFERERADKVETVRLREVELATGINQSQDLTARFRTLMEGYENRIKDLTAELAIRKASEERLERLYDERMNMCNVCPTYHDHLRSLNARPAP